MPSPSPAPPCSTHVYPGTRYEPAPKPRHPMPWPSLVPHMRHHAPSAHPLSPTPCATMGPKCPKPGLPTPPPGAPMSHPGLHPLPHRGPPFSAPLHLVPPESPFYTTKGPLPRAYIHFHFSSIPILIPFPFPYPPSRRPSKIRVPFKTYHAFLFDFFIYFAFLTGVIVE